MHEIGGHEGHTEHADSKLVIPVSVTMSILAVLVAAATLLGHRAHTEAVLLQGQVNDQWSYYQAKNGRLYIAQKLEKLTPIITVRDEKKAETFAAETHNDVEHYGGDKDDITEKAKELEGERDLLRKRADHFDAGEGILEIGLIICSLTLLSNKKLFWFGGIAIGAVGLVVVVLGFTARV